MEDEFVTRSSPRGEGLTTVINLAVIVNPSVVTMLEGEFLQGHRSLHNSIVALAGVFYFGFLIYRLYTEWGDLMAQYRPQELFRDRVLKWYEGLWHGLWTVIAGMCVVWFFSEWPEHRQTWMGPWDHVLRVVSTLLFLIWAIPGGVRMWVALKNRRFGLRKLPSKIG